MPGLYLLIFILLPVLPSGNQIIPEIRMEDKVRIREAINICKIFGDKKIKEIVFRIGNIS